MENSIGYGNPIRGGVQVNEGLPILSGVPFACHVGIQDIRKRVHQRCIMLLVRAPIDYHDFETVIRIHRSKRGEGRIVRQGDARNVVDHVVGHMLVRISLGIFDFNAAKVDIHLGLNVHVSIVFFEIVHRESHLFSVKLHRSAVYRIWDP